MSSFTKSLPSRRKKERERRYRERRSSPIDGGGGDGGEGGASRDGGATTTRGRADENDDSRDDGRRGSGRAPSSPPLPRPTRVSLDVDVDRAREGRRTGKGRRDDAADDDVDDDATAPGVVAEAAGEEEDDDSEEGDIVESSEGTVVEATQVNYPPVDATTLSSARVPKRDDDDDGKGGGVATDIGRDGRAHRRRLESRDSSSSYSSSSDPLVSPVRSSSAVIGHVDDDALTYDAETVGPNDDDDHLYGRGGMTEIGAGGIGFEAVEAAASDIRTPSLGGIDGASDGRGMIATDGVGMDDRREDDVAGNDDGSRATMMKDSYHGTTYREACTKGRDDDILRADGERRGSVDDHQSSETEPMDNIGMRKSKDMEPISHSHTKSWVMVDGRPEDAPNASGEAALSGSIREEAKGSAEFTLTTSDIGDCIAAVANEREMAKHADPSLNPFTSIDIERWQSVLVGFKGYVEALGDPCTTEAIELRVVNKCERAYAIFHRGMEVNHCNAVFVHDMIRMIGHEINDDRINVSRDSNLQPGYSRLNKLDNLAACVDAIFGVNDDGDDAGSPTMAVSVSVSTTGDERTTILKFSVSLEPSNEDNVAPFSTSATLPPHLFAMSQVFECFALEKTRLLQLQVDSTRETLHATREGAMDLQRQALELQDELQVAKKCAEEAVSRQKRAEAEIARQRYDFERRAESFERVKDHYHAELAKLKEVYEREVRDLKAESIKAKPAHIERLGAGTRKRKEMSDGRDDRQRPNDDIKHSTLHLARDAILCVETSEDVDDQISPSIPRNIEYGAIDTFFGSVGADSRGEGRRSMHSSETATPRNSRSEPVDLQNHRRHRASLESTIRGTDRKTERDQLAMSGNNRRNPLESGIKSRHIHSTDFSTSENRKPRNIRELSRRKYQKLHKEMNDRKEGRLTSNVISSSKKLNVAETPDLTPAKNTTKDIDSNNEPSFAYQEVLKRDDELKMKIGARIAPFDNKIERPSRRQSSLSSFFGMEKRALDHFNFEKFDRALAPNFVSGFEESEDCFTQITTKAASLLGAEKCFLFIKDVYEQQLYTFLKDSEGNRVQATKPINRGITGSIVAEQSGYKDNNIDQCQRWSQDLDELPNCVTTCYLAWPIWDFATCNSIGVIEFRNKLNGSSEFNAEDYQIARIIALQLGHVIVHSKQRKLIAGRTEAINQAYEKSFDQGETIELSSSSKDVTRTLASIDSGKRSSQRPHTLSKQSSQFVIRRTSVGVGDKAWDYDVFVKSHDELVMHAVDIFDECGLFSRFSIPITTFVNFVKEVRRGYDSNAPYHNSYHAFDVMHVCYLLLAKCRADEHLESFNILSILVAALAHDLGHDGYNNAFHQNISSELALTYNGISTLENYSAAYLFRILRKQDCNIFARLTNEEMTKMRTRLIDMILDTDAKNHFMLMTRFKHGLEMKKLSRGLLSSMILHIADVSNPARPGKLSRKWAYAVQAEFFRQGDKEKEFNLPQSPFMDRELENLPRMQVAFIDAVVHPVFRLFAEFLPLVDGHCIKPLLLNRAFWQSMLNQGITKTDDIISFLDKNCFVESQDDVDTDTDDAVSDDTVQAAPIPGIPASDLRRMSVISLNVDTKTMVDPELGIKLNEVGDDSLQRSIYDSIRGAYNMLHSGMRKLLESHAFQALTFFATMYALFAFDLNNAFGDKDADIIMDYATLATLSVFAVELVMSFVCVPGYTQCFFWLDVVAIVSLYFELSFVKNLRIADVLALARAGTAAKVGARSGRLASILRLLRVVKISKFAKSALGRTMNKAVKQDEGQWGDEPEKEHHTSMSIIGRKMTESITKNIIIVVVLMLILFSVTQVDYTPDARQIQLNSIAEFPGRSALLSSLFESHDNIVSFSAVGYDFADQERLDNLRDEEILTLTSKSDSSVTASFDISDDTATQAWFSLVITTFVSLLLATMGFLFSRDAYKMVIYPIEKMKYSVQQLSDNPLLHLETLKYRGSTIEPNETDILEQAITKMSALLKIGFGPAGAEIIGNFFNDLGELNPMIPGVRVNAIICCCNIRDFTFVTEVLQQDVIIFGNKIAEITHRNVVKSGGHPNKNIGDAFLLVWKLKIGKNELQKDLFDSSLSCMQKVLKELRQAGSIASFLKNKTSNMSSSTWESSLAAYNIDMGIGLHKGWAIEGAIGSKVKIDASYLSPHVSLVSRLESATKKFNLPLLMSEAFFGGLSGATQSTCRRCDRVSFKGSSDPIVIYHQDIEPLSTLQSPPKNHSMLLEITLWDEQTETSYRGLIKDAQSKLQSNSELVQRDVFDALFNSYIDRDWKRCRILCHLWIEKFPGDAIVNGLAERLSLHDFRCPDEWPGFRSLMIEDVR